VANGAAVNPIQQLDPGTLNMNLKIVRYRSPLMLSSAVVFAVMQSSGSVRAQSMQSLFGIGPSSGQDSGLNSFAALPSQGPVSNSGTSATSFPSGSALNGPIPSNMLSASANPGNAGSGSSSPGGSDPGTIITPQPGAPSGPNPASYGSAIVPNAVGATSPPTPTLNAAIQSIAQLLPFGANLFINATPPSSLAPNPNYIIQPGDTVEIQLYGGETAQSSSVVDTQGNVFLPGFGPVHVAGVAAANLQLAVQKELANAFTNNVSVYAVLQAENSISIYVTGFVRAPGQYLGSASDSVLDFLSRAGGIDSSRGSYRDIKVLRNDRVLQHVDLYNFLLDGSQLPDTLRNGDTILVGRQEPLVAVGGAVRNNYLFEVPSSVTAGQDILSFAQPLASATNVLITGTRSGQPFSQYVSLRDLTETPLYDQDHLTFIADVPAPTITVQVQGSRIGPSVLVADRDMTLKTLLKYIAIDPNDADIKSIYIVRPGLAAQQYAAIQAALDRLQKALFYATSVTTGEAQIRASEASQIQAYINAARTIQPDGILVVADDNGNMNDVRLEEGDIVTIPEASDTVMVDGEVEAPQAINYDAKETRAGYINAAGGTTQRGRRSQTIIRRLSGRLVLDPNAPIMPGDELIVLPYIETGNFVIAQDLFSLVYQVAAVTYFASKL
jgi:protein involved in polysaccharide export with SLBB domain